MSMASWHRAAATLMLIIMLPASVLAGVPLRYCERDGGHRAVEFVLAGAHHAAEHPSPAGHHGQTGQIGQIAQDAAEIVAENVDCRDTAVYAELGLGHRTHQSKFEKSGDGKLGDIGLDSHLLAALTAPSLALPVPEAVRRPFWSLTATTTRSDPRLAAQRTVVLLI